MAQFAGSAHSAEPSPLFDDRARLIPLNCKNEYLVLELGEEAAVQLPADEDGDQRRPSINIRWRLIIRSSVIQK